MLDLILNYFKTLNFSLIILYTFKFLHDFICKNFEILKKHLLHTPGNIYNSVWNVSREFITSWLNFESSLSNLNHAHSHHATTHSQSDNLIE